MPGVDYNKAEAAEYISTSERHLERLWSERRITGYKVGRFVRFKKSDLDDYLERNRLEAIR